MFTLHCSPFFSTDRLYADHKCEDGKAAVVRNGYLPERAIQTGISPVKVRIPRVRSRVLQVLVGPEAQGLSAATIS